MKVKKKTLILTAGIVWLAAGFNVARIGFLAYTPYITVLNAFLSMVVFLLFGVMFFRMSGKHTRRIRSYEDNLHSIFRFFDTKAYCIMIFMMTGGIGLRYSGYAPMRFIAVFYTGLGLALALAGIVFLTEFIWYEQKHPASLNK